MSINIFPSKFTISTVSLESFRPTTAISLPLGCLYPISTPCDLFAGSSECLFRCNFLRRIIIVENSGIWPSKTSKITIFCFFLTFHSITTKFPFSLDLRINHRASKWGKNDFWGNMTAPSICASGRHIIDTGVKPYN